MSRWLDLFRQVAVQIDTPVQLGQKGADSSNNHLSAPNRPICTGVYTGKRPRPTTFGMQDDAVRLVLEHAGGLAPGKRTSAAAD